MPAEGDKIISNIPTKMVRSKGAVTLLSVISLTSTLILVLTHFGIIKTSQSTLHLQKELTYKSLSITEGEFNKSVGMEEVDVKLKSPCTVVISGPTGSGKTELLIDLIQNSDKVATPSPSEIVYCYGVWQDKFSRIEDQVRLHNGMIDIENDIPKDGKNRWLIIDDLMGEQSGTKEMNSLYTKFSHHLNISVFFVVQNLFVKENRTLSLNSHYFFIFKNPRDGTAITNLAKQAFPGKVKFVQEVYQDATKNPYSYLLMDLRQETDERLRLVGNFFPKNGSLTTVYLPK